MRLAQTAGGSEWEWGEVVDGQEGLSWYINRRTGASSVSVRPSDFLCINAQVSAIYWPPYSVHPRAPVHPFARPPDGPTDRPADRPTGRPTTLLR